jgi:PleD family two-component response regulator
MLDEKALILIAHSDWPTVMAVYALLDAEGYFAAPCCSKDDLLKYCAQYKPELVMTSDRLSDDEGDTLLETIRELSPKTRILRLPDMLSRGSDGALLDSSRREEILRIADALPVPYPPLHLNGI